MSGGPVYLDHAATTPLRPEVLEAMVPFLTRHFGNPSGSHAVARRAKQALEEARDTVADCLGALPHEVVFTSGGTEADNLAVLGSWEASKAKHSSVREVLCSAIEHQAVLHPSLRLGGRVIGVTAQGVIDFDVLVDLLDETVAVVSIMLVNNEVGTIQPLAEVVALVREKAPRATLHTDAVQAYGWLDVAEAAAEADLISISGHKFGGPKGVGALVVREGTPLSPLVLGGGQERGWRSGTHNLAAVVGMAKAMGLAGEARKHTVDRVSRLRDRLTGLILGGLEGVRETVNGAPRVAGNAHFCFEGVESEALLVLLDQAGVCASAGSACASGALDPSHVLVAMGVPPDRALGSLRLSLGATTSDEDVERAAQAVVNAVRQLRS